MTTENDQNTAALVDVIQRYGAALQQGDIETILGLYSDRAEVIPDQAPSLRGPDALREMYEATFASIRIDGQLTVTSAEVHGNLGFVRCEEPARIITLGDDSVLDAYFRELFILENTGQGWRILKYMFSQNPGQAAAGQAASTEQPAVDTREKATKPEDLGRLWLERAEAGDIDGVLALYEPAAALYFQGSASTGYSGLRTAYEAMLAGTPKLPSYPNGTPRIVGDLALTSTVLPLENPVLPGAITSEVARRQADGTWLWVIDEANILPEGWGPQS